MTNVHVVVNAEEAKLGPIARNDSRPWRGLVAVLLALALFATACGGGSSDAESASADDGAAESADAGSGDSDGGETESAIDETADGSDVASADDGADVQSGGSIRIALQTEADTLNPTNTPLNRAPTLIATAIFDTLTVIDAEGQWQNNLSESWTPNDDFTSWDMTLREGITFSDGEPLNGAAVVATVDAFFSDPLVSLVFAPAFDRETPVELVDDLTVRFNASSPNAQLPNYFAEQIGMIGSPAWLAARDADPSLDQFPIGAGPYVIEERIQDQQTVLVRNETYWNPDQAAILDRIELITSAEGQADQAVSSLLSGDIDLLHLTDATPILSLRDEGDAITRIEDQSGEEFIMLMNAAVAPFDDVRVREAATAAFPQAAYAEFITQGSADSAETLFSSDTPWHNPDLVQLGDQPDIAGPLVESYCADVPEQCTDGRVDIEYQHDISDELTRQAVLVDDAWSDFFNLTLDVVPNDQHINQVTLGAYDVATWRYHGFADPDLDSIFLSCNTIGALSINFSRNCSPERDALIAAQRASNDFDERFSIWREIQQDLIDSFHYIVVEHTNWVVAADPVVGGICDATTPDGNALPCQNSGVIRLPQLFLTN